MNKIKAYLLMTPFLSLILLGIGWLVYIEPLFMCTAGILALSIGAYIVGADYLDGLDDKNL